MIRTVLALSALLTASALPATAPAFCPVEVATVQTSTPGFYTVTVSLAPTCPADTVAEIHLESFIGGAYPHPDWFRVTPGHPLIRSGIPWYWRLARRVASGVVYRRSIPGMHAPF